MKIKEIKLKDLNPEKFVKEKIKEISDIVDKDIAINALSGGVDSSAVTMIGHRALGDRLKTYIINTGLMREDEPEQIVSLFNTWGIYVELVDAKDKFFKALKNLEDPEEKREAITQTFYRDVFSQFIKISSAKYLLHGTNYTDVEETVKGIKRQHNIFKQIGIDPEKEFGYKIIEPLAQLRKPGVRKIAEALGLPQEIYDRQPFPGPGLAARVIGEVTPERVKIVRQATKILEDELKIIQAFQYLAILHKDKVTGMRDGKREYGQQIELRCWDSRDGVIASPVKFSLYLLEKIADRITSEVPGIVSVTYNVTKKPPSTIEAI